MLLQSIVCHPMFCQSHSVTPTFIWCSIQSAAADHIRLMHITRLLAAPFSSRKRLIDFLLYRNKIFYVANIRQNCKQQQKWYNLYSVVVPKLDIPLTGNIGANGPATKDLLTVQQIECYKLLTSKANQALWPISETQNLTMTAQTIKFL